VLGNLATPSIFWYKDIGDSSLRWVVGLDGECVMPVTLDLRENGHVFHYIITDPWSLADLRAVQAQEIAWGENKPYRIHAFVDMTGMHHFPTGWFNIERAPDRRRGRVNSGNMAIYGASTFIRRLSESVFRVMGFDRARFFDKPDDAWVYLRGLIATEEQGAKTNFS
jgi:hypothetical protein